MLNFSLIYIFFITFLFFPQQSSAHENECIILLHGLGRTHHSMSTLEKNLKNNNYFVVNDSYPSTKKSIHLLANDYIPKMINKCAKHHPKHIHFITHSLGGIILQEYLQKNTIENLAHIVMLGPPNHGSALVDFLQHLYIFKYFLGPSFTALSTQKSLNHLKPHQYKLGIIAGNFNLNPLAKIILKETNDGKVTVSSTKIEQMDDFILLPVTHTFMMSNATVIKQILYFLRHDCFEK